MKIFDYWNNLHKNEQYEEFNFDKEGLLWLKIKSITRVDLLKKFQDFSAIRLDSRSQTEKFRELYNIMSNKTDESHTIIDKFIRTVSSVQQNEINIEALVSELYKMKNFVWGGDYQNSLDKYLISRHIKIKDPSFDYLLAKFETEINPAVQAYVLNSWYNYWSSILIENIFKSHYSVLPTVGKIKNVDFFLKDIPFDLKVTYLPAEFIKTKRQELDYPVEITYLKKIADKAGISFDRKAKPNDIIYEIVEKMKDKNNALCNNALDTLTEQNKGILNDARSNPKILAKWLYENQGEMRFGSENRIFLVLVDSGNFNESWKLKRNMDILQPAIINYLDNFSNKSIEDLNLTFTYKNKPNPFNVLTDILFIAK